MEVLHGSRAPATLTAERSLASPSSRLRPRILAAVALVIAAVALVAVTLPHGGQDDAAAGSPVEAGVIAPDAPAAPAEAARASEAPAEGKFLTAGGYSLPLPEGWKQTRRPPGAALAAVSADGLATTTLFIERRPDLDFHAFEQRSLRSLSILGADARVVERTTGRPLAASSAELRAEVPAGDGGTSPYLVTLRASGPYRYHLATALRPGASPRLMSDAEALGQHLRPRLSGN